MISYNPTLNRLLVSTKELIPQHLGMGVDGGIDAHALDSADHLGHLALVDRSETGELGVVDHARRRCEVLDEGEVLVHVQRADAESINNIHVPHRPLPPLLHLDGAQVVRRVDVTNLPATGHLLEEVARHLLVAEELHLGRLLAHKARVPSLVSLHHPGGGIAGLHSRGSVGAPSVAVEVGETASVSAASRRLAGRKGGGCGAGEWSDKGPHSLGGRRRR